MKTIGCIALCAALLVPVAGARADTVADCNQLEDFDLAIKACSAIVKAPGKFKHGAVAQAYSNRGFAYAERKQFRKAIADYTKSLARNARDDNVYHYRGAAQIKLGNHAKAVKDINKALKLEPYNSFALNDLALAYIGAGNPKQGLRAINRAIKLDSEQANFYETRGLVYEALGRVEQALPDYGSAFHLAPIQRYRDHLERHKVAPMRQ